MATSSVQKTSSQSSDRLFVILERHCAICCRVGCSEQTRAIEAFSSPCLFVFMLQAFIGGKDVLVSLPTGQEATSLCIVTIP